MSYNVEIFGDSVGLGVVWDTVLKRYTILKNSFTSMMSSFTGTVVQNYAKFGSTIAKTTEVVSRRGKELADYDAVLLEIGGNDCDYRWAQISSNPDAQHQPATSPEKFEEKYTQLTREIKNYGGRPVLLSLPPIDAHRYFDWFSRNLNRENIMRWLGDIEHIYRWHEVYNILICKVAAKEKLSLIDITTGFLKYKKPDEFLCEDGIHPNSRGHELIYQMIKKQMPEILSMV